MNMRNLALILVRFLGILFLALGLQGALAIVLAHTVLTWAWPMLPRSTQDNFDYFYSTTLWGTPYYLVAGIVLLVVSKPLARFMSRDVEP